ncbi:DUF3710 domain-containing protein [Demequina sediminicola]|uniref:DUF3710 domain-containing protein n=1 Tax=Demequina sediminicola TaxID=1095026 RepID=UPI00078547FD|nr:DUF3710 domain-containing protein [Demequina sediminicola]
MSDEAQNSAAQNADGLDTLGVADGPWDWPSVPGDRDFVSYGALRLPAVANMRVTGEIDPKTKQCGAVSIRVADCQVQLQVIAAPRGTSQWTEVRQAISKRLRTAGAIEAQEGHFGPELSARMRSRTKSGESIEIPMRFLGVDGPRWLLKAVVMGPSVDSSETRARVAALLSNCAVDRGEEPMIGGTVLVLDAPGFTPGDDEIDQGA